MDAINSHVLSDLCTSICLQFDAKRCDIYQSKSNVVGHNRYRMDLMFKDNTKIQAYVEIDSMSTRTQVEEVFMDAIKNQYVIKRGNNNERVN